MHATIPRISGRKGLIAAAAAVVTTLGLLAGCSATGNAATSQSPSASDGHPNLAGQSIRLVVGATPDISDTKVALIADVLKSWGANATIVNQADDPSAVRAILSNSGDIGFIAASSAINSGLMVFGPSQPRLDYDFVGAPSISKMSQLPGKIYGTSNIHGVEALMFASLLKTEKIDPSKVTVTVAGGASVRVSAMLTGHIQATFVHAQDVPTLTDHGFHILANMAKEAPDLADSFMVSTSSYAKAHPELLKAIDMAWIEAARTFNDDEAAWVTAAVAYGGGTEADAQTTWKALKSVDTYPVGADTYSKAAAQKQEDLAAQVGAITSSPPINKWASQTAWNAAVKAEKLK